MADHHQYALGFTCVAISTLFFGSNFVPVKRYETHDGMFFQWVMCCAIFIVGLIVQLILFAYPPLQDGHWQKDANGTEHWIINGTDSGRPNEFGVTFMPFATLGGVLWATGNTSKSSQPAAAAATTTTTTTTADCFCRAPTSS